MKNIIIEARDELIELGAISLTCLAISKILEKRQKITAQRYFDLTVKVGFIIYSFYSIDNFLDFILKKGRF